VAGRIRDEDVAAVKERANIADVVGDYVTLRSAGGGSLKGLCPFHEEKSPSFNVTPARGYFYCFGCQASGDVISFLTQLEHLSFTEAVERLADRVGVQLRYDDNGPSVPRAAPGQRQRLLGAHKAAAEFFLDQLASADALAGRRFLSSRGFDRAAAEHFGIGYAPRTWEALRDHLRGRGFTDAELTVGGLTQQGHRGVRDRFVGRLMWPIRDVAGDVVGFGARRIHDDDRIEAKYLNTAETPIYKKSAVLYGLDLAKKEIARRRQAVVVEGYTDVMACHLSGVETAVATCGTTFGTEHIRVLRRLLMDQDEFRGEVIFTFDGDAAGRRAALKAFQEDQRFVTQTFVAVEPGGLDPCELRVTQGGAAVRDLVARRVPLFEFAIRSELDRHDLDTPEGRVAALRAAAPVVSAIRDRSLRPEYARTLAGWLGMEVEPVIAAVAGGGAPAGVGRPARAQLPVAEDPEARRERPAPVLAQLLRPDPDDPALLAEREALKLAVQWPDLAAERFDALDHSVFTAPPYAAVHAAIVAAGGTRAAGSGAAASGAGQAWVSAIRAAAEQGLRGLVAELAVEPVRADGPPDERYAHALIARLDELAVTRRIVEVKSRLQRLNPVERVEDYNRLFGRLVGLEQQRRTLRELVIGGI
jgi:DNA primase